MIPAEVDAYYDNEAGPLWRELRGGLWHCTGSHRFRGILKTGAIDPAPNLPDDEFHWAPDATTCCRSMNAVSLFDFEQGDWADHAPGVRQDNWRVFLQAPQISLPPDKWIAIIWIGLDRGVLPKLMSVE